MHKRFASSVAGLLPVAVWAALLPVNSARADLDQSPATVGRAFPSAAQPVAYPAHIDPANDPPQADPVPIQHDYDRFADQFTVKVEGIRPTITKGDSRIFINATSIFDGTEVINKPEKLAINLLCVSDDFQYTDTHDAVTLFLLIDKKRTAVPAKFLKAGLTKDRLPKSLESFVVIVPADVVVRMASGDSVEGQLGPVEFKLGLMEKASIRAFAEAVKLVGPAPATVPIAGIGVRPDELAFRLAQTRIDAAQQRLDEASTRALARLEQSPEYILSAESVKEAEQKKDRAAAGSQRVEASEAFLSNKTKLAAMRTAALDEDAGVIDTRKTLADAQAALNSLRQAERAAQHAKAK